MLFFLNKNQQRIPLRHLMKIYLLTYSFSIFYLYMNKHFCITEFLHLLKEWKCLEDIFIWLQRVFILMENIFVQLWWRENKQTVQGGSDRKWELGNSWSSIQLLNMAYLSFLKKKLKISITLKFSFSKSCLLEIRRLGYLSPWKHRVIP